MLPPPEEYASWTNNSPATTDDDDKRDDVYTFDGETNAIKVYKYGVAIITVR